MNISKFAKLSRISFIALTSASLFSSSIFANDSSSSSVVSEPASVGQVESGDDFPGVKPDVEESKSGIEEIDEVKHEEFKIIFDSNLLKVLNSLLITKDVSGQSSIVDLAFFGESLEFHIKDILEKESNLYDINFDPMEFKNFLIDIAKQLKEIQNIDTYSDHELIFSKKDLSIDKYELYKNLLIQVFKPYYNWKSQFSIISKDISSKLAIGLFSAIDHRSFSSDTYDSFFKKLISNLSLNGSDFKNNNSLEGEYFGGISDVDFSSKEKNEELLNSTIRLSKLAKGVLPFLLSKEMKSDTNKYSFREHLLFSLIYINYEDDFMADFFKSFHEARSKREIDKNNIEYKQVLHESSNSIQKTLLENSFILLALDRDNENIPVFPKIELDEKITKSKKDAKNMKELVTKLKKDLSFLKFKSNRRKDG